MADPRINRKRAAPESAPAGGDELPRRLVPKLTELNPDVLEDFLLATAANFERALQLMGAKPGQDYSALDLVTLAQPFALNRFQQGNLEILETLLDPEP